MKRRTKKLHKASYICLTFIIIYDKLQGYFTLTIYFYFFKGGRKNV